MVVTVGAEEIAGAVTGAAAMIVDAEATVTAEAAVGLLMAAGVLGRLQAVGGSVRPVVVPVDLREVVEVEVLRNRAAVAVVPVEAAGGETMTESE